jgi:D-alanyl-D-alanine carboxypeptidase
LDGKAQTKPAGREPQAACLIEAASRAARPEQLPVPGDECYLTDPAIGEQGPAVAAFDRLIKDYRVMPITVCRICRAPRLGFKANQTIKVEDAIKRLVTKSANDTAVIVAEAIGGSETEFGKLMTLKAREPGMTSTTYVNASGLPAEVQVTTSRPGRSGSCHSTLVSRLLPIFCNPSFHYKGTEMHNHNTFIQLFRWFPSVLKAITIIRPGTLVRLHRAGFRRNRQRPRSRA